MIGASKQRMIAHDTSKQRIASASIASYRKTHKPARFVRSHVLSIIQQYKQKTT